MKPEPQLKHLERPVNTSKEVASGCSDKFNFSDVVGQSTGIDETMSMQLEFARWRLAPLKATSCLTVFYLTKRNLSIPPF